ncbi:MAG: hypothetical protein ABI689_00315, partial [Thermoanaerobaculia bacterium]
LAAFMGYLNSNLAREAGRLARWREKFWGRRYQAILVSGEEEAQISRLAYILAQGAKDIRPHLAFVQQTTNQRESSSGIRSEAASDFWGT